MGKCNRLDKCGSHYTPKQYFTDNLHKQDKCSFIHLHRENERTNANRDSSRPAPPKPKVSVLPDGIVRATEGADSAHMRWIEHLYGTEHRNEIQSLYRTGGIKDAVIFWQRDIEGRVRTGKIMHYDEWSGKRLKIEKVLLKQMNSTLYFVFLSLVPSLTIRSCSRCLQVG